MGTCGWLSKRLPIFEKIFQKSTLSTHTHTLAISPSSGRSWHPHHAICPLIYTYCAFTHTWLDAHRMCAQPRGLHPQMYLINFKRSEIYWTNVQSSTRSNETSFIWSHTKPKTILPETVQQSKGLAVFSMYPSWPLLLYMLRSWVLWQSIELVKLGGHSSNEVMVVPKVWRGCVRELG